MRLHFHRMAVTAAAALWWASLGVAEEDARLARSRELATQLQQALAAKLTAALGSAGSVGAIEVCSLEAPGIAERLSAAGATVRRTSLKVRNPANAPDAAARAALERFERDWQRDPSAPPELFAVTDDGSARYMRAIPTQPLCITCHGSAPATDVAAAIAARYPADRATGFSVGDLRGAFLIDWPAQPESR